MYGGKEYYFLLDNMNNDNFRILQNILYTLPYVFVAGNLRNLPCEQRQENVIEDILVRLKMLDTRDACVQVMRHLDINNVRVIISPQLI